MSGVYCSIDIGGTKILTALLDEPGRILCRVRRTTPAGKGVGAVLETVKATVEEAVRTAGLAPESLKGVGVCIAAFLEHPSGVVHRAPNIGWSGPVHLLEMLQRLWACPVYLENDTNAAVLGEAYFGAARGHADVIYVTISTGIGGGLFLGGKLYRGGDGFAGEIGHSKSFGRNRQCGCGGLDCLEAWASGKGISRSAERLGLHPKDGQAISTAWVFTEAARGNALAQNIVEGAVMDIGTGLANAVTLLNPTCLVLGGTVVAANPDFRDRIKTKIKKSAIMPAVGVTALEIVPAQLEPEAGLWGMYTLMKEPGSV